MEERERERAKSEQNKKVNKSQNDCVVYQARSRSRRKEWIWISLLYVCLLLSKNRHNKREQSTEIRSHKIKQANWDEEKQHAADHCVFITIFCVLNLTGVLSCNLPPICCILVPPFFFIRLLVFCSTYHPTSRLLCLCCLQLEPPLQQQHDALLQVLPLKDQKISPGQCRIFFKTVLLPSCVKLQHQILTFPCSIWSFNHTVDFCPDCLVF